MQGVLQLCKAINSNSEDTTNAQNVHSIPTKVYCDMYLTTCSSSDFLPSSGWFPRICKASESLRFIVLCL